MHYYQKKLEPEEFPKKSLPSQLTSLSTEKRARHGIPKIAINVYKHDECKPKHKCYCSLICTGSLILSTFHLKTTGYETKNKATLDNYTRRQRFYSKQKIPQGPYLQNKGNKIRKQSKIKKLTPVRSSG